MQTKKILSLVLFLLPFAVSAQTNFSVAGYGTSVHFPQEIFFGDSEEVYHVGRCAIRGTINNEITWSGYCYTPVNLFAGDAPARANCFVVGAQGVIRKNESCEIFGSWDDQSSGTIDSLFSVKFFNVDTGFVVGQNGKVLRTFNNGRNWTILPNGVTQTLRRIIFTPNRTLYAVGDNGVVMKSTDTAGTWTVLNTFTTERINDIDFIGNDTGYVVGTNGLMLKTTDAGINWTPVISGVSTNLNGVDFVAPGIGYIVGDAGVIRKTTNDGSNWTASVIPSFANNVADVKFRDTNNGYFAAQSDIYRTINGGTSWFNMSQELRSVRFPARDTGYIVGANVMKKTTDGGLTWSSTHPFNGVTMYASFFLTTEIGFAGGYFGRLYKTIDGGNNWTAQNTHSSNLLRAIHFFNANKGIAVGSNYTIARTTNGGATWITDSIPNGNLYGYHDLSFPSSSIGYLCGAAGAIRKTTNGGTSFTVQTSGVTNHLNKIYFLDTLKGFTIGENGTLLKTINGGVTWTPVSVSPAADLRAIAFYDSLNGYIAGAGGAFFETKNGGNSWTFKNYVSIDITDITFFDGYHGYLVGANDFRARYEPMKTLEEYSDVCNSSGFNLPVRIANNIQIDTGNVFVMEMDTSGSDFSDPLTLGAVQSDTGGAILRFNLIPEIKEGLYKVRLRATKTEPLQVSIPTTLKVFDDPVASITQSNDTLFTTYRPDYIYQWRKGLTWIPGATFHYLVITQPDDYSVIVNHGCCNTVVASIHANQCSGQWVKAPAVKPVYYVCDSSRATLIASGVLQFHWYDSDSGVTVISTDSFFVTPPIMASVDTFYVSAVYGACESDRMKVLVYRVSKPAPPVVTNYTLCDSEELFVLPSGGSAFNWYTDSTSLPFLTNAYFYHTINPVTDTIYISNSNYDCQSNYVPFVIQVDNAPVSTLISGDVAVTPAQIASYYYLPAPGNTIQWTVSGGTFVLYADSIVVTWGMPGSGFVSVSETNTNGCSSDTVSLNVTIQVVSSVENNPGQNIFIFPNPVTDQLNIEIQNSHYDQLIANLYDALGRCIKTVRLKNFVNEISLKDVVTGLYFVKITDGEKNLMGKLIFKEER